METDDVTPAQIDPAIREMLRTTILPDGRTAEDWCLDVRRDGLALVWWREGKDALEAYKDRVGADTHAARWVEKKAEECAIIAAWTTPHLLIDRGEGVRPRWHALIQTWDVDTAIMAYEKQQAAEG
ncbi:hypothetical protein ACGFXC_10490 [Streptomyces sp. NPDC048507]|uniref:hypothetical protein n=1 Tax=Streptomyces sp. NPDC048507 TaxID=3365560 RepID=UPI003714B5B5